MGDDRKEGTEEATEDVIEEDRLGKFESNFRPHTSAGSRDLRQRNASQAACCRRPALRKIEGLMADISSEELEVEELARPCTISSQLSRTRHAAAI